jgi:hypothetical protein
MWATVTDRVDTDLVGALIKAGADVNAASKAGDTPMKWAMMRGETPVVAMLREAGAKMSATASPTVMPFKQAAVEDKAMREAVAKSVKVLNSSAGVFFKQTGCVSCHNQTLPMIASKRARERGINADAMAEDKIRRTVSGFTTPMTEAALETSEAIPDVHVSGAYILMSMHEQGLAPNLTTTAMVHIIASRQMADGSWPSFGPRPPMENGEIQATAFAVRAIQLYRTPGRKSEFNKRIANARQYLRQATPVTTEEQVSRMLGLYWAGAKQEEVMEAARVLLAAQREDGGWAQLATLTSDAYATGRVLTAMVEAGGMKTADAAYQRGASYLLSTQYDDGSWLVKTRAYPFQPLKDHGFPHGRDQWISAAATSYAAMALTNAVAR